MKNVFLILGLTFSAAALTAFCIQQDDNDLKNYVVKVKSKWAEACNQCESNTDTYTVYYKNTSTKKLDIMIGVREELPKSWRISTFYGVKQNDTLRSYACKGTGSSLVWAREAGDKSYVFPTQKEIDDEYPAKK